MTDKRYYIGNPIRGIACNVHPAFFSCLDEWNHIDPEVYKKVVESFKELPPPSGKDLTNERI